MSAVAVSSISSLCCCLWKVQLIRRLRQVLNQGSTLCGVTQEAETIRRVTQCHLRVAPGRTFQGGDHMGDWSYFASSSASLV